MNEMNVFLVVVAAFLFVALLRVRELINENFALKKQRDKLRKESNLDELTGLPNRRALARALDRMNGQLPRPGDLRKQTSDNTVSVINIDLKGFKSINDKFGHDVGDKVLKVVGGVLNNTFTRKSDIAGRWGGDEFLVLLFNATSDEINLLISRVKEQISSADYGHGVTFEVIADAGVFTTAMQLDPKEILVQADEAMYRDKIAGKAS